MRGRSSRSPSRAGLFHIELAGQLIADEAGGTGYEIVGELVIGRDDEEAAALPARLEAILARQADGMPNVGEACMLGP